MQTPSDQRAAYLLPASLYTCLYDHARHYNSRDITTKHNRRTRTRIVPQAVATINTDRVGRAPTLTPIFILKCNAKLLT